MSRFAVTGRRSAALFVPLLAVTFLGLLSACASPVAATDPPLQSGTPIIDLARLGLDYVSAGAPVDSTIAYMMQEDFEGQLNTTYWSLSDSANAIAQSTDNPHSGTYSLAFNGRIAHPNPSTLTLQVSVLEISNLRFWIRTDIGSYAGTTLSFSVDGVERGHYNGLSRIWVPIDTLLPVGTHTLEWKIPNAGTFYYPNSTNSIYLDDLSLCPDRPYVLGLGPGVGQEVVAGDTISYSAKLLRIDGSPMGAAGQASVAYEVVPATGTASVDSDGTVHAAGAGRVGIRASSGSFTSITTNLDILPQDYLDLPFTTPQSVTYQGKAGGGTGQALVASGSPVSISSPIEKSFPADAFFTIHGSVAGAGAQQYAMIEAVKSTGEVSDWFVRGSFAHRLWLRYGAGTYTVSVYPITVTENNNNYDGDINYYTYYPTAPAYTFIVTNTNTEDGHLIYPSDPLQVDDLAIRNLAARLVGGKTLDKDRLLALHDFVVESLYYDKASLAAGARKKQDALSSLANRTAVCEGYTSLFGALARAAGYKIKAEAGIGDGGAHAWNLVTLGGLDEMVDCTFDDPGPDDTDPGSVSRVYFLLASLTGINNDHTPQYPRPDRSLTTAFAALRFE